MAAFLTTILLILYSAVSNIRISGAVVFILATKTTTKVKFHQQWVMSCQDLWNIKLCHKLEQIHYAIEVMEVFYSRINMFYVPASLQASISISITVDATVASRNFKKCPFKLPRTF